MTGRDLLEYLLGSPQEVLDLPVLVSGGGEYGWDPVEAADVGTKRVVKTETCYGVGSYAEVGVENLFDEDEEGGCPKTPPVRVLVIGQG